jgi:hypothetical protein
MPELGEWGNFYMIVGSAAGALVGLQFVVLTLIADRALPVSADANAAFSTPTIVHFTSVLLLSAALVAPWHSIASVEILWMFAALAGLSYAGIVVRRMVQQTAYKPGFEDWLFHAILPSAAYLTLGAAGLAARSHLREALFGVGAVALLLLFIGIHNAWDAVVWHVLASQRLEKKSKSR